ncbi:quinone oxidoreductase family protein [Streptomyces sp. SDT5-1]|uniref:quinone oxidoreductase family protein n=1 Tax=Streptomyces sp. SDT5-1 TaxID=3406418 RepID=UPI003FCF5939
MKEQSTAPPQCGTATMRAITIHEFGAPALLMPERRPVPSPGPGEVLVRVGYVALSRFLDLIVRHGRVPGHEVSLPHIPGGGCAGTVEATGQGVDGVRAGQRVAVDPVVRDGGRAELVGVHRQGAYADFVVVPASCVYRIPDGVPTEQAAALALSGPAAAALLRAAGVGRDTRVLVQGAGSGLGCTAALLAKCLGAEVAVATPRVEQLSELRELGFAHAYASTAQDAVLRIGKDFPDGFDVVVHNMGAPKVWEVSCAVVRAGGTIALTGLYGGVRVPVDLNRVMTHDVRIVGVSAAGPADHERLWAAAAEGFRTRIARTWPLEESATAHQTLEEGVQPVGRIVFRVAPDGGLVDAR